MSGWDCREATTKELVDMIQPQLYKSGYERLLADVIKDRLQILEEIEHTINMRYFDFGGEEITAERVYTELREESFNSVVNTVVELATTVERLQHLCDQVTPQMVKTRVRTKYEEAQDAGNNNI